MSRPRIPAAPLDASSPARRRRPNPVLVAGIASLTVTLLGGWWFVLRAPERSEAALCAHLARVAQLDERLATSPDDLEDDVAELRAAVAVAPGDIAADVEVLAVAVHALAQETDARPDDPVGGLRAGMSRLAPSAEQLEASSARLVGWADTHCGLRLGTETAAGGELRASHPDGR